MGFDIFNGIPIIVLVNFGSTSEAEILTGFLKDHKMVIVLGNTTFGKGSVQTIFSLTNIGGALKLITSFFYTSFGNLIQFFGITPDIFVSKIFSDFILNEFFFSSYLNKKYKKVVYI